MTLGNDGATGLHHHGTGAEQHQAGGHRTRQADQ